MDAYRAALKTRMSMTQEALDSGLLEGAEFDFARGAIAAYQAAMQDTYFIEETCRVKAIGHAAVAFAATPPLSQKEAA